MRKSWVTRRPTAMSRAAVAGTVVLSAIAATAASAAPYPRPRVTRIASVDLTGNQGPADSFFAPSMTADAGSVAFTTKNPLLTEDTNSFEDVYVRDLATGKLELVSVTREGGAPNGRSILGTMSPDGRYVVFSSRASDLAPGTSGPTCESPPGAGPARQCEQVFLRDRVLGRTDVASVSSDEVLGDRGSNYPTVTPDGRHVAFASCAKNLVPGDTHPSEFTCDVDIFVRDMTSGTTERVNVLPDGSEVNNESWGPCISADGDVVAFQSDFPYVDADTNDVADVFVRDRDAGTTELVSATASGISGNGPSLIAPMTRSCLSADGRLVAFDSAAKNLVPFDTNESYDSFVHDRLTGDNERVSLQSNGEEFSYAPVPAAQPFAANAENTSISPDGRFVAFTINGSFSSLPGSAITSNVPGWPLASSGPISQAYVHDRRTGLTELVSAGPSGAGADGPSRFPNLSADGRGIAFTSSATNIVSGDSNDAWDVFAVDRGPAVGIQRLAVVREPEALSVTGSATFSGTTLTSSDDAVADGDPTADAVGAELTGADIRYRVETDDLLVRWRLASLPSGRAESLAVAYDLGLEVADVSYRVRVLRAGLQDAADPPGGPRAPSFVLYRCADSCEAVASLSGGFGTSGNSVTASVPLGLLAQAPGGAIRGLNASTSLHDGAAGTTMLLDEVRLEDAAIPPPTVALGIAPEGVSEDDVVYDRPVPVAEGGFSSFVDTSTLAAGDFSLWAKACVGNDCGARSTGFTVSGDLVETLLELSIERDRGDAVATAALTETATGTAIPGKSISFTVDGEQVGIVSTDEAGKARVTLPASVFNGQDVLTAAFAGDESYAGSSATRRRKE